MALDGEAAGRVAWHDSCKVNRQITGSDNSTLVMNGLHHVDEAGWP